MQNTNLVLGDGPSIQEEHSGAAACDCTLKLCLLGPKEQNFSCIPFPMSSQAFFSPHASSSGFPPLITHFMSSLGTWLRFWNLQGRAVTQVFGGMLKSRFINESDTICPFTANFSDLISTRTLYFIFFNLLPPHQERNIKLVLEPSNEEEDISDGLAEISLDGFHSDNATGAKVHLDADGNLNWPVLFLYPEHEQTDFIEAFHENSR